MNAGRKALRKTESAKSWLTYATSLEVPDPDSDPSLSGYNKKKYIAKLLYIYILGFDVDFGHKEAIYLMAATKYQEKQIVNPS